ncbi:ABC transporter ATP-binding protein [Oceanotoga sp. DSM 15011]|jgi:peptide/nickel transport system ATP-binding protein|uniref:Peptide/nickel transport system ATP-binding protein n=1 Tax=Oceanotoga teriensis TaxID=515440 RepID=A0AA45HJE7_9BACT|nr:MULTISPECIES: ABC transporter ATP-binding protein [Oceanotoga]MDN5343796.1 peptide/nickel transport system ATP-binding protein [Oceanotoga sp.]MDO7975565.1 ABC transporter ATP-binding protein [Oceanotoga teriensis]PWJ96146.1 peptide/nickel transport system ATP-binding protein [Oceanotoga teriensis]UYO99929.1 ABC transporter ATP-binding protein [Oceanotoga sp. DSM 15011]
MIDNKEPLLSIKGLKTYFKTEDGVVKAVNGMDFDLFPGETLAIVGESGSGKSVTSLSLMDLLDENGFIPEGEMIFKGKNLKDLSKSEYRKIKGNEIAMIFQEPMTALNPVFTIGEQIGEMIRLHMNLSEKDAKKRSIELLQKVGIPEPSKRIDQYPHELSGGMRQRAMIAMALSCDPDILIADEPTTALDVTIQAQILELMKQLQKDYGMAIIFITHDLGVVAEMADRAIVMYGGEVFEKGDIVSIFKHPKNPYTWGLMNSIPRIDLDKERLWAIPGAVPNPLNFPKGCKFSNRCFLANEKCVNEHPELAKIEGEHLSRCWRIEELEKEISKVKGGENNG